MNFFTIVNDITVKMLLGYVIARIVLYFKNIPSNNLSGKEIIGIIMVLTFIILEPFEVRVLRFSSPKNAYLFFKPFSTVRANFSFDKKNYVYIYDPVKYGLSTMFFEKRNGYWYYGTNARSKNFYTEKGSDKIYIEQRKTKSGKFLVLIYYVKDSIEHKIQDILNTNFEMGEVKYPHIIYYYAVLDKVPNDYDIYIDDEKVKIT